MKLLKLLLFLLLPCYVVFGQPAQFPFINPTLSIVIGTLLRGRFLRARTFELVQFKELKPRCAESDPVVVIGFLLGGSLSARPYL